MSNDAEAQEVHATVTDAGNPQELANGGQAQRPDVLDGEVVDEDDIDDDDIDDENAVIIEEMPVVRADDGASPGSADDAVAPPDPDDEPDRDQVTSTPAATAVPDPRRPGMPVGAGTPTGAGTPAGSGTPVGTGGAPVGTAGRHAGAGMPADTNGPADTNMVGYPARLHEQWAAIQSTFVDDPRGSVAAAAEFVTETIAALVATAQEREHALRGEWERDGVDTEGLRNALRSYRGLLDQLVSR